MTANRRGPLVLVLLVPLGCGDDLDPETVCGDGTVERNGACLPTLACGGGTRLDPALGECVPDGGVCSPGTVLMGDRCEPIDEALDPDLVEAAEPNDVDGAAGAIALPETEAVIAYGCIEPYMAGGEYLADQDSWRLTVAQPVVLELESWGAGGLAPAFDAFGHDPGLLRDFWVRSGLENTDGHARWEFLLPAAGDYELIVTDARSRIAALPAGGPGACYHASLRRLPLPEPVAVPAPVDVFPLESGVRIYSIEVGAGEVAEVIGETSRLSTRLGLTLLVDGEYGRSVVEEANGPAVLAIDDSIAGEVVVAVDASIDFGYAPVEARVLQTRSDAEGAR
jgi:hypothetical protein